MLDLYEQEYDPRYPVVCMDEQPKQLIAEIRQPLGCRAGAAACEDYEYVRKGVATVWMFVEPLGCWRDVRVSARRTAIDWAEQLRELVDCQRYVEAVKIRLVCDQLNTHRLASLYKAFPAEEAHRIASKIELVHTPCHGSWLNMAEPELSVLTRQSLSGRIAELQMLAERSHIWSTQRNAAQIGINWQFTTEHARTKLKHLYPVIEAR